jgi:hypothetical protein
MNNNEKKVNFNIGTGENIPEWVQWFICIAVLGVIAFYSFKTPELKPAGKMQTVADSIISGDISSKSRAMWELQNASSVEAASLVNILIDSINDETPADPEIAEKYHARKEELIGPLAGFYTKKTITIGDLAAFSINRIRRKLLIDTAGDGGPTTTLVAVRKVISNKIIPMLRSENEIIRIRILSEVLPGDTDPSPIDTLLSCCLEDSSATIRKYALIPFITYVHSSRGKVMIAVPKIIDLLNDPDEQVRYIAHRILTITSGTDMGTNADQWKEWLSKSKQ